MSDKEQEKEPSKKSFDVEFAPPDPYNPLRLPDDEGDAEVTFRNFVDEEEGLKDAKKPSEELPPEEAQQ